MTETTKTYFAKDVPGLFVKMEMKSSFVNMAMTLDEYTKGDEADSEAADGEKAAAADSEKDTAPDVEAPSDG